MRRKPYRPNLPEGLFAALVGLVFVIAVVVVLVGVQHIPCGFWQFSPAADVPARCLSHFTTP